MKVIKREWIEKCGQWRKAVCIPRENIIAIYIPSDFHICCVHSQTKSKGMNVNSQYFKELIT